MLWSKAVHCIDNRVPFWVHTQKGEIVVMSSINRETQLIKLVAKKNNNNTNADMNC